MLLSCALFWLLFGGSAFFWFVLFVAGVLLVFFDAVFSPQVGFNSRGKREGRCARIGLKSPNSPILGALIHATPQVNPVEGTRMHETEGHERNLVESGNVQGPSVKGAPFCKKQWLQTKALLSIQLATPGQQRCLTLMRGGSVRDGCVVQATWSSPNCRRLISHVL